MNLEGIKLKPKKVKLDSKFWASYFQVYDLLNLLIPYQELLNNICDELNIKPREKVLDAGSGTGNLATKIKSRGGNVIGIDNSSAGITIHKRKDSDAKVVLCDLTQSLPFPNDSFDKIASNNVLYVIPREKQEQVMKEFYRILKPSGKIVLANMRAEWKPLSIYIDAVEKSIRLRGPVSTSADLLRFVLPTVKMFYYSYIIYQSGQRNETNPFTFNQQRELLFKSGFVRVSETKEVYSKQGILNSGYKPNSVN